jgi:uncharacterized membrane protein
MPMDALLADAVHWVTRILEAAGTTVILVGALVSSAAFLWRFARGVDPEQRFGHFRTSLGRSILLGLEFLVAADIVNTVAIDPTLDSLAVLAGIVLVRTFLSFALEVELEGRWPWQRHRDAVSANGGGPGTGART